MTVKNRGVALVMVLWLTTLLSLMASNLALTVRRETMAIRNGVAFAQVRHWAIAGIRHAQLHLLTHLNNASHAGAGSQPSGAIFNELNQLSLTDGVTVQFMIQPETSKVDLNTAPAPLLTGLLQVVGVTQPQQSQPIVDAIVNWRDTNALAAESAAYRAAGYPYGPRHALFGSVHELQGVLGVTPELYQRLVPFVTVYSFQTGVYAPAASRYVLMALPTVSTTQIDNYIAQRRVPRSIQPPPVLAGVDPIYTTATEGHVFSVIAAAQTADASVRVALEQVVSYQPSRKEQFIVLNERWMDRDEETQRLAGN